MLWFTHTDRYYELLTPEFTLRHIYPFGRGSEEFEVAHTLIPAYLVIVCDSRVILETI